MRLVAGFTIATLLLASHAWAAGGGSMGGGSSGGDYGSSEPPKEQTPDQIAKNNYNRGVKEVERAKSADEDAAKATDAGKKQKLAEKARKSFSKARDYFLVAVDSRSDMYQAWNYLGYTQRKLGNYDKAIAAYDQALGYNPAYGEAIEYRGEAYLALGRLDDAKAAYMHLFRDARPLAAELMTAMQKWIGDRRQNPQGLSTDDLDAFAKWVDERAALSQKAALGQEPSSAPAAWN
ncbi:MAG TPA: tetratricopeptide repeat protein [Steroidobacteraceae bacterium]|nr:tetratricopeptide repeat protein [Steroidobacteraceae bacterium]